MRRLPILPLLLAAAACAGVHEPGIVLIDVDGAPRAVLPVEGPHATVLLFVATDCPISNYFAPEFERIHAEYAPKSVDFYLVYADAEADPAAIDQHIDDYGYAMPALLDPDQDLLRHTHATVTPEAVVLSPAGDVLYRGRIDDTYVDYGVQRAEPSRRDLRLALDDVLAGRDPEVARTEAVGCFIPLIEGVEAELEHADDEASSCCDQ